MNITTAFKQAAAEMSLTVQQATELITSNKMPVRDRKHLNDRAWAIIRAAEASDTAAAENDG